MSDTIDPKRIRDGGELSVGDLTLRFRLKYDHHQDPPWKAADGHGPVSGWTTRDKRPGERTLSKDRGSKRYYDFAGAMVLAKRDGWGLDPDGFSIVEMRTGCKWITGDDNLIPNN